MKSVCPKQPFLYVIPALIVVWTVYLRFYLGPYYLQSIDPEYMYLISGMNAAALDFNKIGHVDHPGTPLQLLSGLFFRIIHLFTGHRDIVTDVISGPELYLAASSILLAVITFFLILRLGQLVYRYTSGILGALVLQASGLYTGVHIGILARYSPDRLMPVIVLLFFIIYIRYLCDETFSDRKFAVLSGIIMAAGVVTKFNFVPLLILPYFLIPGWRPKRDYTLSLAGSAVVFFLPVSSRIRTFWRIMRDMFLHSGLYGSGEQNIIDASGFLANIGKIFTKNPSFTIITILAAGGLILLAVNPEIRKKNNHGFRFLLGSMSAIALGLAITAKHYKGYYALPILSLAPMIYYMLIRIAEHTVQSRYRTPIAAVLFGVLLLFPFLTAARNFIGTNEALRDKRITEAFIRDRIPPGDYFIITPIWRSAPMPENAMVLGVSYIHHERLFYLDFERVYPNILTWEGSDQPLKHMRMRPANLEEVLLSGRGIHIYSGPDWNAPEVCRYLEDHAKKAGIKVERDTVYAFARRKEHIIRYRNTEGWKKTVDLSCGFEKSYPEKLMADDGRTLLYGDFTIREGVSAHGFASLLLNQDQKRSPAYLLNGIEKGDAISSSVKIHLAAEENVDNILIVCEYRTETGTAVALHSGPSPGKIDPDWYMTDLFVEIGAQPAGSIIRCYVACSGDQRVHLDDFTLEVYSRRQKVPEKNRR